MNDVRDVCATGRGNCWSSISREVRRDTSCRVRLVSMNVTKMKNSSGKNAFKKLATKLLLSCSFGFWYVGCHRVMAGNGLKPMAQRSGSPEGSKMSQGFHQVIARAKRLNMILEHDRMRLNSESTRHEVYYIPGPSLSLSLSTCQSSSPNGYEAD